MFEPISKQLSKQLTDTSNILTTDKQLTVAYKDGETMLDRLPVTITSEWKNCVIGHIQHFGFTAVMRWAEVAATKNKPEQYLMTILSRQRYGKR